MHWAFQKTERIFPPNVYGLDLDGALGFGGCTSLLAGSHIPAPVTDPSRRTWGFKHGLKIFYLIPVTLSHHRYISLPFGFNYSSFGNANNSKENV